MDDEGGEDKMQDESSDPESDQDEDESDNKSDDESLITLTTVLIPCSQPPSVQQPSHASTCSQFHCLPLQPIVTFNPEIKRRT